VRLLEEALEAARDLVQAFGPKRWLKRLLSAGRDAEDFAACHAMLMNTLQARAVHYLRHPPACIAHRATSEACIRGMKRERRRAAAGEVGVAAGSELAARSPALLTRDCAPFAQVVAASAALTQRCRSVVFSNDESARLTSELRRLGGSDSPEEALRALQDAGRTDELLQLLGISDQVRRTLTSLSATTRPRMPLAFRGINAAASEYACTPPSRRSWSPK
jgi:hypothetical protein